MNFFSDTQSDNPDHEAWNPMWIGSVVLILFVLFTLGATEADSDWAYILGIASGAVAYAIALIRYPSGRLSGGVPLPSIFVVLIAIFLAAFAYLDTRTERWEKGAVHYTDTYGRWSGKHIHRDVSDFEKQYFSDGPMAGTGKPHGMWKWHQWNEGANVENRFEYGTTFFWYGDKITEGEWHLRNR